MDLKDTKLFQICQIYLRKKDIESATKKREENIKAILKALLVEKTSKESIDLLEEITDRFNEKLDERLKRDLQSVEVISMYKKLKRK